MKKWSFDIIDASEDLKLERFPVFETDKYIQCKNSYAIRLILRKGDELFGQISFTVHEDELISGYCASYGGFYLKSFPGTEILRSFIEQSVVVAKQVHCDKIIIRQHPEFLYPEITPWVSVLLKEQGFEINEMHINHHLDLNKEDNFNKYKKGRHGNRLKYADDFKLIEHSKDHWEEYFDFIKEFRDKKNYKLSLTKEQLKDQLENLPDNHMFFTLENKKEEITARCISLIISSEVVYNFYPAYDPDFRKYSPYVIMLLHQSKILKERGFNYIDLGSSMQNSFVQNQLADFKSSVGGEASTKLNWIKSV
ncbi:GNAT family N-acetyltransferase [Mangrovivirga sp. M17]|uniref:GNAT family N-acetyltransferase n=1 Tax=Mangrovivirga halotolerans TaxID=2993936 RepID=A0ABT3RMM7_9BACT|nr:GNAT family N-acetyltransferase [Mangrovivirga halotolerans]MCX2742857.1 GNAT family N-acetyltransferase [Mangrovivirga halotolerans]